MIIYGTKATHLISEFVAGQCPNCGTNNSIQISVYQRYAHIFWIPFFPVGKTGVSICNHCKQVLKLKQMPESLRLSYNNLKLQSKTPIWNFAGIGLVVIIVISVAINDKKTTQKVNKLVTNPKAGDVLHIKEKEDEYTLYKVTNVTRDSVYLVICKYQTDQENGLDDLAEKGFDTVQNVLSKAQYVGMNDDKKVIDIDRN